LNKEIGAKKSWNGQYTVDCDKIASLPDITFTFSGYDFSLPATDYIMNVQGSCISSFTGLDIPPPLGIPSLPLYAVPELMGRPHLDHR
jgi:saccharopepsin